jgi:hypothetical protein
MKSRFLNLLMVIGLGFALLNLAAGCEPRRGGVMVGSPAPPPPGPPKQEPPPWAPAHGHRAKRRYHYYPSQYVYYDIGRGIYFYLEGDGWHLSTRLPAGIHLEYGEYVVLELETDEPYQYFSAHKRKYPPGQAKKQGKKKKW